MQSAVLYAAPVLLSLCVNPDQLKIENSETIFFIVESWLTILEVLFPDGDDDGAFIIPAFDAHSCVFSIRDRRNGIGKPVFKLASLGSGHFSFILVTLDLSVFGFFA